MTHNPFAALSDDDDEGSEEPETDVEAERASLLQPQQQRAEEEDDEAFLDRACAEARGELEGSFRDRACAEARAELEAGRCWPTGIPRPECSPAGQRGRSVGVGGGRSRLLVGGRFGRSGR